MKVNMLWILVVSILLSYLTKRVSEDNQSYRLRTNTDISRFGVYVWVCFVNILMYRLMGWSVAFVRYAFLISILAWIVKVDVRAKIIPNRMVGLLIIGAVYFEYREFRLKGIVLSIVFIILLSIISLLSKGELGMGDAKLIGAMCLYVDEYIVNIVIVASFVCLIIGVYNMLIKKADVKKEIPFTPCIYVAVVGWYFVGYFN